MTDYRLYCLDAAGRFFRCEEFSAANDEAAAERALALRGDSAAELWAGARMVASFSRSVREHAATG